MTPGHVSDVITSQVSVMNEEMNLIVRNGIFHQGTFFLQHPVARLSAIRTLFHSSDDVNAKIN